MRFFDNHILTETFKNLKGNTRFSILTEPLWFIPYALFAPFQSLYMRELGLSSKEIGFTITMGLFLQVFFAIFGGIVTDKMGRRKATYIFDTIAWTVPCFIWAFSQNFWWFLAAAGVNAAFQITNISWNCLFIEDCPPKYVGNAFMLAQMCGMLSVFFAPIAIILVGDYGVVPVVRWLYFISGISMFIKFWILYRYGDETKMGKIRLEETKDVSYWEMLKGYKSVFIKFISSRKMLFVMVFISLINISTIPINSFFSIYVTETLLLPTELIAVFPMIRTFIMILFVIGLQNVASACSMRQGATIGLTLYIASHLLLILAPQKGFMLIMGYTALEAMAFSFVVPRKDELMALYVDNQDRSRISAIYNATMIAITTPFGMIFGTLFEVNSVYPFYLNIIIFALAIILIRTSKDVKNHENEIA